MAEAKYIANSWLRVGLYGGGSSLSDNVTPISMQIHEPVEYVHS